MIFLFIYLCLFSVSVYSVYNDKRLKKTSICILLFLFVLSAMRYSLGADYFSYAYIYKAMPHNLFEAFRSEIHSEIGFKFLIVLSKNFGLSYEMFLVMIAAVSISFFGIVIIRKSKYPLISIQILYTAYYLTYINSSIRQGLAMSLVFYGVHKFYLNNKHKEFAILVFFTVFLHTTAFFILLIYLTMFIYKEIILKKKNRVFQILVAVYILGVVALNATKIPYIIFIDILKLSRLETYFSGSVNVMALSFKLIWFLFITLMYVYNKKYNDYISKQYYLMYLTGFLVYLLSMSAPISSRILEYFTMFEIILIPFIMFSKPKLRIKFNFLSILSVLLFVLLIKDINSFTHQEEYKKTGFFRYRYFSVFDKDRIDNYKEKSYYLEVLENLDK